jgi:putative membrane protein
MFFNAVGAFLLFFVAGAGMMVLFAALYLRITTHDELSLIRAGNLAAGIALSGTLAGFAIPLTRSMTQSATLLDMIAWALVALVVQFLVYFAVRWLLPDLSSRIERGEFAAATFLAAVSVIAGLINAASMTV